MQPRLGLCINSYLNVHFLLTVFQIGITLSFFLSTMLKHLHHYLLVVQGRVTSFASQLIMLSLAQQDYWMRLFFKPWVPFRRVQECNHILPCPQYKPGHYLINSWRKAISLSCSALSIICHALLMSMTSLPSGGTQGR